MKTENRLTNTADFNRGNALTEHLNSFLLCPVFGTEFSSFLLQILKYVVIILSDAFHYEGV